MAISAASGWVEQVATVPPAPPYLEELTSTRIAFQLGTCAVAVAVASALFTVRSRSTPLVQNVASKYVATDFGVPDGQAGLSAPLWVEATSTRCTLIARRISEYGSVSHNFCRNASTSVRNFG